VDSGRPLQPSRAHGRRCTSSLLHDQRDSSADPCVLIIDSRIIRIVASFVDREGGCGPPVVEGGADPPGPIPNPIVKRASAGGYCGSNATGDAATAGGPHPFLSDRLYLLQSIVPRCRGVEQRQLVGLITRRSAVRIRPPLSAKARYRNPCTGPFCVHLQSAFVLSLDSAGMRSR